jgi:hypothetical protein
MRWFVEVSRVGEHGSDEKYCVEAKQWQAALQEARKLRGDSGPLSKFSIELLDEGYRAVDPKQKLRYVVAKAPQDAELSSMPAESAFRAEAAQTNGQSVAPPAPRISAPPAPVATSASVASAPVVAAASAAPAPMVAAPAVVAPVAPVVVAAAPAVAAEPGFAPHAEPYAGVPSSALSPAAPAQTASPSAAPPRPDAPARPVTASPGGAIGITVPMDAIPPAPPVPQGLGPVALPQAFTQPSAAIDMPPPATVLRKRQEEPTPESPIIYREVAYLVDPGVSRGSVESLLWASFNALSRELASRPGQKFVQLAVFDHQFEKRPERPPLGTLAWKDWRGNPVLTFPHFDGTQAARVTVPPPSIVPVAVVSVSASSPPAAAAQPAPVVQPTPAQVAPAPAPAPVTATSATSTPVIPLVIPASTSPSVPAPAPAVIQAPPAASPTPSTPPPPAAQAQPRDRQPSQPSAARASKPRLAAVRRRAGEDLIGELFETMHDLHFMSGIADGAEFVLAAVESIVPCEGVLIHVFDINKRQFCVVRAKGPGTMQAILLRTPDTDEHVASVMRRSGSVVMHDTAKDPRILGERWDALGVKPQRALCCPVRQGGRYLGLLEIANPLGDTPFHQTEQNAIDYVCEQFAQFLANRPIVLDSDVILRR